MNSRIRRLTREPWGAADAVALGAVAAAAGILRFAGLATPSTRMFDETYYARDACWYVYASRSVCGVTGEQTTVHPPLGKDLIALGIRVFGYNAFGWRVASAVAGTLLVVLTFALARKVLGSTLGATVAGGLAATDLLAFVQSRIAMLDIFAALFGLAAVLCAALDRDAVLERDGRSDGRPLRRPWRLLAGLAVGAATASKWSGVLAGITVLALVIAWELGVRRSHGARRLRQTLRDEGASILLYLAIVPALLYLASYAGRLDGALLAPPWAPGAWLRSFWDRQIYMYSFHSGLGVTHAYESPPWSWLALKRPVSYFFRTDASGDYMEVLATGSPLVWWGSVTALVYVARRWLARRNPAGPEGLILASFALGYLPWLVLAGDRSAVFLFYVLPVVPFMCLALGYVAARAERVRLGRAAVALFCTAAMALFVFYFPLLTSRPLARAAWLERIWIFDDCSKPVHRAASSATAADKAIDSKATDDEGDRPPPGWCWI